jgi:hypothetical protein
MARWVIPLVLLSIVSAARADLELVADGQAKAVIVVGDSASSRTAARMLTAMVQRVSGAKLATATAAPADKPTIAVGESALTKQLGIKTGDLKPGGFVIKTVGNVLVIAGNDSATTDPDGTAHGVEAFVEQSLGVRYLWPGELGLVTPTKKTLAVPAMDIRSEPAIAQRRIRSQHYNDRIQTGLDYLGLTQADFEKAHESTTRSKKKKAEDVAEDWFAFQKLGGNVDLQGGHAFGYVWDKYDKEHPEWFALQPNGSRDLTNLSPQRSRLCKSNMALIEQLAKDKIEELRKNGGHSVSLCLNDGGLATFCQCENCKKLDDPNGRKIMLWDRSTKPYKDFEYVSLTDRHVWFWNQLAERITKEFPNAWLTVYAYSVYSAPPVHEKLHPNIAVGFVGGGYSSNATREQAIKDWMDWSKKASKLYWRPNLLLMARRSGTPICFAHKMAEDVKLFSEHGLIGTDFDSCTNSWATEGLNYYVLARVLWDPKQDVDAIIDDYCKSGFGPAAAPIKRYFARIEALTDKIATDNSAGTRTKELDVSAPYTPAVCTELEAILAEADKAAAGDDVVRKRIDFLRTGIKFTRLQNVAHHLIEGHDEGGVPLTADQQKELMQVQQEKWLMMRHIARERPLAVNVANVAWGGEGTFRRFGFKGAGSVDKRVIDADENGRPVERPTK